MKEFKSLSDARHLVVGGRLLDDVLAEHEDRVTEIRKKAAELGYQEAPDKGSSGTVMVGDLEVPAYIP
jgi:hypothetical protein